jgi:hypothetical protein
VPRLRAQALEHLQGLPQGPMKSRRRPWNRLETHIAQFFAKKVRRRRMSYYRAMKIVKTWCRGRTEQACRAKIRSLVLTTRK